MTQRSSPLDAKTLTNELVLAVVRGQLPLSALEEAGIYLPIDVKEPRDSERRISLNLQSPITVAPNPIDIANGLLAYKTAPDQLREWATFVLGASEVIDLAPLETWPEGEELLNGLWDASFEGGLKQETVRLAGALTET
jgi:hypothetical protein